MAPRTNLKSALAVAGICGLIALAAYPIVIVPLQDRSTREAPAGGFSKGSMWSSVDAAARSKQHNVCNSSSGTAAAAAALARQLSGKQQVQAARWVATAAGGSPEQLAAALSKARRMAGPVGLLAGVFGSIVGVGGGVVIVPAIVSACKTIPQRVVSGTSLAAVLATALSSAYTYSSAGCVELGAAALISPAAMLTAPFGARLTSRLDCAALRRILGYFLLAAAPLVPLKAYLLHAAEAEGGSQGSTRAGQAEADVSNSGSSDGGGGSGRTRVEAQNSPGSSEGPAAALEGLTFPGPATAAALLATGAVAGVASGLLGVGGGLIVTPLLALTMPYPQSTVLGTSLLSMIPPASAALAQHHRQGNVDWRMAATLAVGTAIGSVAGSSAAVHAPPGWLELAFCLCMAFLGRKTLATAK
ncbi:hypothetical protein ABPG75_004452 [Micractinium tetrahymenae]